MKTTLSSTPLITIYLSVYNGEKYLSEQLQSIQAQSYQHWELLIRDDHSDDQSISIIKSFVISDTRIRLISSNKQTIGVCNSFHELMLYRGNGTYFMFADQDDVWCTTKIEHTLHRMLKLESGMPNATPILLYTNLVHVNQNLKKTNKKYKTPSIKSDTKILYQALIQNWIFGCTMMFNSSLLELSLPIPCESIALLHDRWLTLIAASAGKINYIKTPELLHRLHDKNATSTMYNTTFRMKIKIAVFMIKQREKILHSRRVQCKLLHERLVARQIHTHTQTLQYFLTLLSKNGFSALYFGLTHGFIYNRLFQTLIFYIQLFLSKKVSDPNPKNDTVT